jgi:hypothetical protein
MKITEAHKPAFEEYVTPLQLLELAFQEAGADIELHAEFDLFGNKEVIIHDPVKMLLMGIVAVEGISPVDTLKNIAVKIQKKE